MNYWAAPGIKQALAVQEFNYTHKKKLRYYVSICPNNGVINFYMGATVLMGLEVKQKVNFLWFGAALYFYKSDKGVSVRIRHKENLTTQSRQLGKIIKSALIEKHMNTSYSYRCCLKQTKSEFNGNVLYEVMLPMKVKSAIKQFIQ